MTARPRASRIQLEAVACVCRIQSATTPASKPQAVLIFMSESPGSKAASRGIEKNSLTSTMALTLPTKSAPTRTRRSRIARQDSTGVTAGRVGYFKRYATRLLAAKAAKSPSSSQHLLLRRRGMCGGSRDEQCGAWRPRARAPSAPPTGVQERTLIPGKTRLRPRA
jgi:hypothetical protein